MKISTSETSDPNYLATVVEIKTIEKHPNADKLQLTSIFGNSVILGLDTKVGDKMVYCPVESCLAAEYLTWANMFDKPELNADQKTKGYFSDKRRVKAVRLRGMPSNGIAIPLAKVAQFYGVDEKDFPVLQAFDTVDGKTFITKYVSRTQRSSGEPNDPKQKKEKELGISKLLLPNQFRLHGKTTQLGSAVHTVRPSDIISVTSKLHGTSAVFSNVLCNRPLTWKDKLAKFFGVKVVEQEYRYVYSSRNIIKNRKDGEWSTDVWGLHASILVGDIPPGISIYSELVGYMEGGKMVQKQYDYGCNLFESKMYVYRITYTDPLGNVLEFDHQMIKDFCDQRELSMVPIYYYGPARDLFDIDPENINWPELFLEHLKETYLEKNCELCTNKVVREGIVLKNNSKATKPAFKLKSFSFLEKESADRDQGIVDIEEES